MSRSHFSPVGIGKDAAYASSSSLSSCGSSSSSDDSSSEWFCQYGLWRVSNPNSESLWSVFQWIRRSICGHGPFIWTWHQSRFASWTTWVRVHQNCRFLMYEQTSSAEWGSRCAWGFPSAFSMHSAMNQKFNLKNFLVASSYRSGQHDWRI